MSFKPLPIVFSMFAAAAVLSASAAVFTGTGAQTHASLPSHPAPAPATVQALRGAGQRAITRSLPSAPAWPGVRALPKTRMRASIRRLVEQPTASGESTIDTAHYQISYDPAQLTAAQADEAGKLAEQAWTHCQSIIGSAPPGKIRLELTPSFMGASGVTIPGRNGHPSQIAIRYSELPYLGLRPEYVITHETGHVFSGDLAGGALGEGIADWAAGTFSGIPMQQWWAKALQDAHMWVDTDAFFITGDFDDGSDVNVLSRTADYTESALLVKFLVDRFGWDRFKSFATDYNTARGSLQSHRGRRGRRGMDADAVRATFQKHFGVSWDSLRADWDRAIQAQTPPALESQRLVTAEKVYGAIRNYEGWVMRQRQKPDFAAQAAIRGAFRRANEAVARDDFTAANQALNDAWVQFQHLREPAGSDGTLTT